MTFLFKATPSSQSRIKLSAPIELILLIFFQSFPGTYIIARRGVYFYNFRFTMKFFISTLEDHGNKK